MTKGFKLTDTQAITLAQAAMRPDGAAITPAGLNAPAAAKLAASLVSRNLMQERSARPGLPVWRKDETGRAISLVMTPAGRAAIGVEAEGAADVGKDMSAASGKAGRRKRGQDGKRRAANTPSLIAAQDVRHAARMSAPRAGSKQALVVGLLAQDGGATLEAIVAATGWLPHSARAALTGLRKRGLVLERQRPEGSDVSVYRIACDAAKRA